MSSRLTPIRQIEAKRLLTHLVSQEPFDADRFVELLAAVMIDTPEIVEVVAKRLENWNCGRAASVFSETPSPYEEITEVVLDAAAIYRGETSEEPTPYEPRGATQADFNVWRRVLTTLHGNRDCFQRAASGIISKGAWEAQATACSRALAELGQLLGNAGMADSDTGV